MSSFGEVKSLPLSEKDGEVFSVDFAFEKNWFVEVEQHPSLTDTGEVQTMCKVDEVVPQAVHVLDLLSTDECEQVVNLCDKFGFRQNGNRPASLAWVTLPEWTDIIRDRLINLEGQPYGPCPHINHRWRVYKYGADCELPKHMDRACVPSYYDPEGVNDEGDTEGQLRAHAGKQTDMSLLIYISATGHHQGGATRLYGVDGREVDVEPVQGNAVTFPHRGELYGEQISGGPGGGLWHAGLPVTGGLKYIVRTDIIHSDNWNNGQPCNGEKSRGG